jgi:hypothetical protein
MIFPELTDKFRLFIYTRVFPTGQHRQGGFYRRTSAKEEKLRWTNPRMNNWQGEEESSPRCVTFVMAFRSGLLDGLLPTSFFVAAAAAAAARLSSSCMF